MQYNNICRHPLYHAVIQIISQVEKYFTQIISIQKAIHLKARSSGSLSNHLKAPIRLSGIGMEEPNKIFMSLALIDCFS